MAKDLQFIDGDLPPRPRLISGVELIAQRIRVRLQTHRGEWLLNRNVGLPYLRWRAQKPPLVQSIGSRVREAVRTTPGVVDVLDFRAALKERQVVITGRVIVEGGQELLLEAEMLEAGNVSPTITIELATSGAIL